MVQETNHLISFLNRLYTPHISVMSSSVPHRTFPMSRNQSKKFQIESIHLALQLLNMKILINISLCHVILETE